MLVFDKKRRDEDEVERAARQEFRNRIFDILQSSAAASVTWELETSKHVALMSLAGLTGVFALIAGNRPIPYITIPALCFAFSSLLTTLSMRQTHKQNVFEVERAANSLKYLDAKGEWSEAETCLEAKVKRHEKRAGLLFSTSLGTLILGGIVLFVILSKF